MFVVCVCVECEVCVEYVCICFVWCVYIVCAVSVCVECEAGVYLRVCLCGCVLSVVCM